MRFFINTIDIKEINSLNQTGMVDEINTNPSILAKATSPIKKLLKKIAKQKDNAATITPDLLLELYKIP